MASHRRASSSRGRRQRHPVDVLDAAQHSHRAERHHRDPPPDFPLAVEIGEVIPQHVKAEADGQPEPVVGQARQQQGDDHKPVAGERCREDHVGRPNAGIGFDRQPHPQRDGDGQDIAHQGIEAGRLAELSELQCPARGIGQQSGDEDCARELESPPRQQRFLHRLGWGRIVTHHVNTTRKGSKRPAPDRRIEVDFAPHALEIGQ